MMDKQERSRTMDLDKAWLYRQGSWTGVDDPAAKFPEEVDNLFEKLHYNPAPRTYGVPGKHYVPINYGPLFPMEKRALIAYPDYPYYIEVEVEGVTDHHFYIAYEPSYLQLVPQLDVYVYKALQLKLLIEEEFPEADK
jgi:hypothetical protein